MTLEPALPPELDLDSALRGAFAHLQAAKLLASWLANPEGAPRKITPLALWEFLEGATTTDTPYSESASELVRRLVALYPDTFWPLGTQ